MPRHLAPHDSAPVGHSPVRVGALSGALVLAVGLLAWGANAACLAPPLGVTAFLVAKDAQSPACAPRSILLGHAIGLAAGYASAYACGVFGVPGALSGTFALGHALASALAIALTVGLTESLRCPHPPAGATTLVASLGLLPFQSGVPAFMAGSLVLSFCAWRLRQTLRAEAIH